MALFGPPDVEKLKIRGNVKGLVKAVRHSDLEIRASAARALAELGEPGVTALVGVLREEAWEGWGAAMDLAEWGGSPAVEALLAALRDDSEYARTAAFVALKRLGKDEAGDLSPEDQARVENVYHSLWREVMHAVPPGLFPRASKLTILRTSLGMGSPRHVDRFLRELPTFGSFNDIVQVWKAIVAPREDR